MIEQIYRVQFAADAGMAVLIWLVQLVIYPAFKVVRPDRFAGWHRQYMKAISFIVIPLMIIQALCHGFLSLYNPSISHGISTAAIAAAWVVTFALSVPCQNRLQQAGCEPETINCLIRTNWLRTLFWTVPLVLSAW